MSTEMRVAMLVCSAPLMVVSAPSSVPSDRSLSVGLG